MKTSKKVTQTAKKKGRGRSGSAPIMKHSLVNTRKARLRANGLTMNAVGSKFVCSTSWVSRCLSGIANQDVPAVQEICRWVDALPLGD